MKNAAVSTAAKTAAIVLFVCALGGALLVLDHKRALAVSAAPPAEG